MSLFESASICVTPNGTKASKLYAIKPTSGAGDLSVVRATTATRVNSAGLIESVAVNVPRLDYLNGTCPSILVEPQRTNLLIQSNNFNSLVWLNSGATITPNSIISPDGTQNATKLTILSGQYLYQLISVTASNVYTISFYAKVLSGTKEFKFNVFGGGNNFTSSIYTVNTQWQRFNYTFTASATGVAGIYPILVDGLTGGDFYIYGSQTEIGSYPTSYVPTTTAAVTRNADVISKTGISSLIGQTEGTMLVDINLKVNFTTSAQWICFLSENADNYIALYTENGTGKLKYEIQNSSFGGQQSNILSSFSLLPNTKYKIAAAYKNNDVVLYLNGVQIGTDTSGTMPSTSKLLFDYETFTNDPFSIARNVSNVSLWKTRLTNAELAELTTL